MAGQPIFYHCVGSRALKGFNYIKAKDREPYQGVPFPQNLRPNRRNRPHRTKYPSRRQHVVTEEEKAQRDPIILTKNPNFVLPEAGKTLMRLGPKTCPTPRGPIDEKALHESFVRFRENLRWAWHRNKGQNFETILDTFEKEPWYERTQKSAPIARDCPQLEAFLDACFQDLFNPSLRKKISDNLTKDQRDFMTKYVKEDYPNLNIRIRREDK